MKITRTNIVRFLDMHPELMASMGPASVLIDGCYTVYGKPGINITPVEWLWKIRQAFTHEGVQIMAKRYQVSVDENFVESFDATLVFTEM